MEATIVYDAVQKAQVIQPVQSELIGNLALFVGIVVVIAVFAYLLHKTMQKRTAHEYHVAYKTVKQDHPAIAKLRNRKD